VHTYHQLIVRHSYIRLQTLHSRLLREHSLIKKANFRITIVHHLCHCARKVTGIHIHTYTISNTVIFSTLAAIMPTCTQNTNTGTHRQTGSHANTTHPEPAAAAAVGSVAQAHFGRPHAADPRLRVRPPQIDADPGHGKHTQHQHVNERYVRDQRKKAQTYRAMTPAAETQSVIKQHLARAHRDLCLSLSGLSSQAQCVARLT